MVAVEAEVLTSWVIVVGSKLVDEDVALGPKLVVDY
jgi:hypothetical protein